MYRLITFSNASNSWTALTIEFSHGGINNISSTQLNKKQNNTEIRLLQISDESLF